jgi:outer membrane protein insertion porin family
MINFQIKIFRLITTLTFILCLSEPANASRNPIAIDSLPESTQSDVKAKYPQLLDGAYTIENLDNFVRFLMANPDFESASIIKEGEEFKLKFIKTKKIDSVNFQGCKEFSCSDIAEIFAIESGVTFELETLAIQGEKVRTFYQDRGFLNAIIDIEYPLNTKGNYDLTIKIKEGPQTTIAQIIIDSNDSKFSKALEKTLKKYRGQSYNESLLADIQQSANEYFSENRYLQSSLGRPEVEIEPNQERAIVKFKVDKTSKFKIIFSGYHFFTKSDLEDIIDLDSFTTSAPKVGDELSNKIKVAYLASGFARVEVAADESLAGNEVLITVKINEGTRIKLGKIEIQGRVTKGNSWYQTKIKEISPDMTLKGYFVREELDTILSSLVVDLQNQGYLQAKLNSSRVQFSKEKDKATVTVNLDEGPQTFVEKISFEGNRQFSPSQLESLIGIHPTEPLKLLSIEDSINKIKDFYKKQGYLEVAILNEKQDLVQYSQENTQAQLVYKIYEGPQIKVGSILIEGNTYTKNYVILLELDFKVGAILTPGVIEESISRLQRTGYFSSLEIRTLEERSQISNRTVIVKVAERDPGLFNFGAGLTNDRSLTTRGYIGISYRNWQGTGQGFSARVEGNYNVTDIQYPELKATLGYLRPYLFETRTKSRLNITRSQQVTDYDKREVTEVNQGTWSLEQDFTSHVLGIFDVLSLATVRDFRLRKDDPTPEVRQNIASTGPTLDVDFRDHPFNPTKGTFSRFNIEYSSPELGSSKTIEYYRANASFTHYLPISKIVFANSIRGGYLQNLSKLDDGGVPYDKKGFILGGRSTIRGFEAGTSESFPNDQDLGSEQFSLKGQSSFYLVKSELRFPLWGEFSGALFYDGGEVKVSDVKLPYAYRDAAGIGLRLNTPVGPVNFEWAWKLNRRTDRSESPYRFHFSIGTF